MIGASIASAAVHVKTTPTVNTAAYHTLTPSFAVPYCIQERKPSPLERGGTLSGQAAAGKVCLAGAEHLVTQHRQQQKHERSTVQRWLWPSDMQHHSLDVLSTSGTAII
jgi:hypothetical protein